MLWCFIMLFKSGKLNITGVQKCIDTNLFPTKQVYFKSLYFAGKGFLTSMSTITGHRNIRTIMFSHSHLGSTARKTSISSHSATRIHIRDAKRTWSCLNDDSCRISKGNFWPAQWWVSCIFRNFSSTHISFVIALSRNKIVCCVLLFYRREFASNVCRIVS